MSTLLAAYLAASLAVGAPTEVEIFIMPPGRPVVTEGVRYQGFTFDEYKLLLQMDNELYYKRKEIKLLGDLKLSLEQKLEQEAKISKTLRQDVETYKGRSDRIEKLWEKCEVDLVEASSGSIFPWVVAAVGAGIGLIGIGMAVGANSK